MYIENHLCLRIGCHNKGPVFTCNEKVGGCKMVNKHFFSNSASQFGTKQGVVPVYLAGNPGTEYCLPGEVKVSAVIYYTTERKYSLKSLI